MDWQLRRAGAEDVPALAVMNQRLIADEGSRNPMALPALAARMAGFLASGWQAVLIAGGGEPIGYCLFQVRPDDYVPDRQTVYVRQYFIASEHRRAGLGRAAFERIAADFFPADTAEIGLEVLTANPGGERFWRSLGFAPYSLALKRERAG